MKSKTKICISDSLIIVIFAFISAIYYLHFSTFPLSFDGDFGAGAVTLFYSIYSSICNGELPLWSPHMWCGTPALGHPCFQAIYPINLVLYLILQGSSFELFIALDYAFHLFILCCGLYLLQRLNKISIYASFISTLIVVFSYETMFQTSWTYLFTGFVWFPLIIDFIILFEKDRSPKGWRYVICGGIILGLSGLANPGQPLLITILFSCILYLCFIGNNFSKQYIFQLTGKMLSFGILGMTLCAPALFPTMEFSRNCMRFIPDIGFLSGTDKMPIEAFVEYDVSFASIGTLFQFPTLNRDTNYYFVTSFSVMASLFGIIGFFRKTNKSQNAISIFAKICFAFVICYSTGFVLPYLFYYIPFFDGIREPFLYFPYFIFPLALFTGKGVNAIQSNISVKSLKEAISYPICMGSLLLITIIGIIMPYKFINYNCIIALLVLCIFLCNIIIRKNNILRKSLSFGLLFIAFILQIYLDISQLSGKSSYKDIYANIEKQISKNAEYITTQKNENVRYSGLGIQAWPSNSLVLNNIYDAQGYLNPVTRASQLLQYVNFDRRVLISNIKYWYTSSNIEEWPYQAMQQVLNGKYIKDLEITPYYDSAETATITIWEIDTLGTAWVVNDIIKTENLNDLSEQQVADLLNSDSIDFRTQSYLAPSKSNIQLESGENKWHVETDMYSNNQLRFIVDTEKRAILTTSEIWYPGWNVYVDGQKQEVLQVNCCFRGCEIPSGTHIVEYKYEPPTLYLGLTVSVIGIFYSVFIWFSFIHKAKIHKEDSIEISISES